MNNLKILILMALCLALEARQAVAAQVVTTQFLNALAEEARTNAAILKASEAQVSAAQAERAAVRTWEDPELMLGGVAAKKSMRMDDGDIVYGVEQALPLFGKPAAARGLADAEIEVAVTNHEMEYQFLRRDLTIAVYAAALAEHELALIKEEIEWARLIQNVAEERYANGAGSQVETLRAQAEFAKALNMRSTAEQELEVAQATLNRLLNRETFSKWPTLELPEVSDPIPFDPAIIRLALSGEPKLRALREEIRAAEARTEVARKMAKPEVAVGLEGRQYSGSGAFREGMAVVKMSFPLLNRSKYRADILKQEALAEAAEAAVKDYEAEVSAEIRTLLAKIDTTRREAVLQKENLIPRAEQTLAAAEAAWRAGEDSLRMVLEVRWMLVDSRRAYYRAVADHYRALSELVLCCGLGDLEALQILQEKNAAKEEAK